MKVALAQIKSTDDIYYNLLRIHSFVSLAEELGAKLVCFPENCFFRGPADHFNRKNSQLLFDQHGTLIPTNDFSKALIDFMSDWKVYISFGSVLEYNQDLPPFNTHAVFDPHTQHFSLYRKIHLFQFQSLDHPYDESKDCSSGDTPVTVNVDGFNVGLSICYDLRFPELFRNLVLKKHCDVLLVPAAFTYETGKEHWHTLLRARAIENQSYVVAAAQWGTHLNSKSQVRACYGHSISYDPWGKLLVEIIKEADEVQILELSKTILQETRSKLPALVNAKTQLF